MAGTVAELVQARTTLHRLGDAGKRNFGAMLTYIKLLRELNVHDPESVTEYGSLLLSQYRSRLSDDELWQLHEDVALAAAATGAPQIALRCAEAVQRQFPASVRAKLLSGVVLEAGGSADAAAALYAELLESHPGNAAVMKRQVALHMGKGDTTAAIDGLVKYLDIYQTDKAGWQQLYALYLRAGLLEQARFCMEEVLMHTPSDVVSVLKLADLLYAQGGAANVSAALAYYSKVVSITLGNNVRALYGVLGAACCLAGLGSQRGNHGAVVDAAGQMLLKLYGERAPDKVPLVQALMQAQQAGA